MAPIISNMTTYDENLFLKMLSIHHPCLQVDILEASAAVKEGENFMSVVSKVNVVGHDYHTGELVNVSFIKKVVPESEERRILFQCDAFMSNEVAFYRDVLPALRQQNINLAFADSIFASVDCIILRHLGQDGFVMSDRRKGLDLHHCQLVLKELGKFHAASLALKHHQPRVFKKISSTVKELLVTKENPILDACVENAIETALSVANNQNSKAVDLLKQTRDCGYEALAPYVVPKEPLAVICHGDLWSNNMLFRYKSNETEHPTDVAFLDLQAARYASPALDILYFLLTSSTPGVAQENFRQLIMTYHRSLVESMKTAAPLAPTVSFDDILAEIKNHGLFGLVVSLMVMPVVTAEDVVVNLDSVTEHTLNSQAFQDEARRGLITPGFKLRVNEALDIFYGEGFQ